MHEHWKLKLTQVFSDNSPCQFEDFRNCYFEVVDTWKWVPGGGYSIDHTQVFVGQMVRIHLEASQGIMAAIFVLQTVLTVLENFHWCIIIFLYRILNSIVSLKFGCVMFGNGHSAIHLDVVSSRLLFDNLFLSFQLVENILTKCITIHFDTSYV